MATDNPEAGQYPDVLRELAVDEDRKAEACVREAQAVHQIGYRLRARACQAGAAALDSTALASPTLPEVEARLTETYGDRASLHCARTGGAGAWSAWVTVGAGVIAATEATSIAVAVEALLWPERIG